jgi:ABC-type phosphate transport system substrate-binding protein
MQARSERTLPKSNRTALKSVIFVAVLLTLGATTIAQADTITVAGSTAFNATIMVPHQKEIEAISGHTLIVLPSKTDLGVRLLLEKRADLAMISTALELLTRSLKETDPPLPLDQLRSFDVYRSSVAFTVHPSNRLRSIKTEQLRKVLLGTITNWRELGGSDLRIRLVMVESGAGIPLTLETLLLDGKPIAAKDPIRVRISSQVAKVVEQEPGALGLTQANNIPGRKVAILTPERQIEQALSYVTLGEPSPAVRSVIDATQKIASKD